MKTLSSVFLVGYASWWKSHDLGRCVTLPLLASQSAGHFQWLSSRLLGGQSHLWAMTVSLPF